jgi:hypothetical protein
LYLDAPKLPFFEMRWSKQSVLEHFIAIVHKNSPHSSLGYFFETLASFYRGIDVFQMEFNRYKISDLWKTTYNTGNTPKVKRLGMKKATKKMAHWLSCYPHEMANDLRCHS